MNENVSMYALRAYSYTRARVCMYVYVCVREYVNIFPRAYIRESPCLSRLGCLIYVITLIFFYTLL